MVHEATMAMISSQSQCQTKQIKLVPTLLHQKFCPDTAASTSSPAHPAANPCGSCQHRNSELSRPCLLLVLDFSRSYEVPNCLRDSIPVSHREIYLNDRCRPK